MHLSEEDCVDRMCLAYLLRNIISNKFEEKKYTWVMSHELSNDIIHRIDFPYAFSDNKNLIMLYGIPVVISDFLSYTDSNDICNVIMYPYLWLKEVEEDDIYELLTKCNLKNAFMTRCVEKIKNIIERNKCDIEAMRSLYVQLFSTELDDGVNFDNFIKAHISHLL